MTRVLIRGGHLEAHTQREEHVKTGREKLVIPHQGERPWKRPALPTLTPCLRLPASGIGEI